MKKIGNEARAALQARWGAREGSVKLTDIMADIMKNQALSPDDKKRCFQYLASLIDVDLGPKELDAMLETMKIIEQENTQERGTGHGSGQKNQKYNVPIL